MDMVNMQIQAQITACLVSFILRAKYSKTLFDIPIDWYRQNDTRYLCKRLLASLVINGHSLLGTHLHAFLSALAHPS